MENYINPFTGWSFNRIFGLPCNKALLVRFLNDVLDGELVIRNLTYLSRDILQQHASMSAIDAEVLCMTDQGVFINLAILNHHQESFWGHVSARFSALILDQIKRGVYFHRLKPVYSIFLFNFQPFDKQLVDFRTDVASSSIQNGHAFNLLHRETILVLPKFDICTSEQCVRGLDRWIFALKQMEKADHLPFINREEVFRRLESICRYNDLSELDREAYEKSRRSYAEAHYPWSLHTRWTSTNFLWKL